ncbi:MAG: hypothetical protein RLZZ555_2257 [Pseudomonadota bacterium]|jgi:hypothetical protein
MNRTHHMILIAAAAMGLLALGALMDGPSDMEIERAVQTDLQDAIEQARREAPQVRVELARLEADDTAREPTQRVAMLDRK